MGNAVYKNKLRRTELAKLARSEEIVQPDFSSVQINGKYQLKNDRFSKNWGSKTRLYDIYCVKCNARVLVYQKDGTGNLKKCYLNRILAPSDLAMLHHNIRTSAPKDVPDLKCHSCHEVLGTPYLHEDGRIAYRIRQGFIFKRINYNYMK
jgi:hypothetical protein